MFLFIRVEFQGSPPAELRITGKVSVSSLELLAHETGAALDCLRFGSVYYGTDVTRSGLLYNNSPDTVAFVALLNDTAIGQQLVHVV